MVQAVSMLAVVQVFQGPIPTADKNLTRHFWGWCLQKSTLRTEGSCLQKSTCRPCRGRRGLISVLSFSRSQPNRYLGSTCFNAIASSFIEVSRIFFAIWQQFLLILYAHTTYAVTESFLETTW